MVPPKRRIPLSIVGIVAEYNPFHNGHLYHLDQARMATGAEAVVCVMSGNFVQRGEPAIIDKWARAEMALRCGADLVFELPFCFAVRSAYNFALGAVQTLDRTGVVTHICFGAETPDLPLLQQIAFILSEEPEEFRTRLKALLDQGHNYPLARASAVSSYLSYHTRTLDPNQVLTTMMGPNNILAIEYLRALRETKSSIVPVLVPRVGSGYHDTSLTSYASATAIRGAFSDPNWDKLVKPYLPSPSHEILLREIDQGKGPVQEKHLEPVLLALLRRMTASELAAIHDITEGLEHRIKKAARQSNSLIHLKNLVKTKRYNLTRINRILLYVLFNLTKTRAASFDETGPAYLRLLGLSPSGQKILLKIKSKCRILLINRVKTVNKLLSPQSHPVARDMFDLDVLATDIYSLFFAEAQRQGGRDYTVSPIRIR